MAIEYSKALDSICVDYLVIGRSEASARIFEEKTRKNVIRGGLDNLKLEFSEVPNHVIIAVDVEELFTTTVKTINLGIKTILVEKPGALDLKRLVYLKGLSKKNNTTIKIAYNQGFFQTVQKLKSMTDNDVGIKSCHFEFSEWASKLNLK